MMPCKQDEANRVRDMAERKFAMQDFVGAKECLVEAQQLFPPLEGATEMLAFLDARIAAHGMTETDWRDIQEAVVRAEAAFKSIGEAFGVLSAKAKKYLLSSKGNEVPDMASHASESVPPTPAQAQAPHDALTFWTTCPFCKIQVLYVRARRGSRQLCQNCHKVFLATDMNVHSTNGANAFPESSVPHVSGYQSRTCARIGGVAPGNMAGNRHTYVHSAGVGGTAGGVAPLNLLEEARLWAQKDRVDAERELQRKVEEEKLQLQRVEGEALRKEREKVRALEETVQQLTKMQQEETCRKAVLKAVDGREKQLKKRNRDAYDERDRLKDPVQEQLAERPRSKLVAKLGIPPLDSTQIPGAMKKGEQRPSPQDLELVLRDSDFHDFQVESTQFGFKKNQIWAIFDDTDGMPRYYCRVQEVNRNPFMVDATWLHPVQPCKDTSHWLKERDLSISCGEFNPGDEVCFFSVINFSHVMTPYIYKKGYEIYPKTPEVWAMYRDYDKELPISNAGKTLQLRFDYVLIRSDFSVIAGGGRVVRLEKLAGYRTLWVPKGDAFPLAVKYDRHKFSHRVLALPVTKEDIQGVPAGCLELDPASAPVVDAIEPK